MVGTDGNILAANGALASRVGCTPAQLQAEPLTSLLVTGQPLPAQFEEVLRCGVQGLALASSYLDIPWRSGAVERVEVRVSPMYDEQSGSMRQILVSIMPTNAPFEASQCEEACAPGGDASMMDASSENLKMSAHAPPSATVEGVRNVAGPVQQLLHQESDAPKERQAATAWSVLFASVLQKSMFSCVLLARANGDAAGTAAGTAAGAAVGAGAGAEGAAAGAAGTSGAACDAADPYSIWYVSRGLEDLLGVPAAGLLGRTATVLCASADAPAPLSEQSQELHLHHAIATRTNCLIETVLTTSSGAPLFCLAYVLPLHSSNGGARTGTTAVAFLDVHRSLPYMQRQMEARELGGCDLYTFVKFSLLNCLVTDPSGTDPSPAKRNPIIFASAGFSAMCGAAAWAKPECRALPPWAVSAPQLSPPCASSGRAWRPSAARHSSRGAPPGQWHPSHGLSCSSEPPPRSCLSLTAFVHPSQAPRPRRSSVATAASSSRPSFTRRPSRLRRASTAKPWGTWRRRSTVETVVALPRQCPSWAPAPPQGAPGGFGRLGTPRVEASPPGARPLPWVLAPAASKVADFMAFDHVGGHAAEALLHHCRQDLRSPGRRLRAQGADGVLAGGGGHRRAALCGKRGR